MSAKTFTAQPVDRTAYSPDTITGKAGFIEYVVRFTNDADASETFDDRIQADGTDLDLQNQIRIFLTGKFAPPPADKVADSASFKFSVNSEVLPILSVL